jgi:phage baseplate assembly protein W
MAIARLLYGFLSQSTDAYNIKIPWQISNQDGMFRMNYSIEDSIRDNLIVWAKTNWGDRPMRFRFGLDTKRALFEPESISKDIIENNAKDQLAKFFPFLNIKRLEVLTSKDVDSIPDNTIKFILEATYRDDENKKISINEDIGM